MAFRFSTHIKVAPGLRLNFSQSGIGASLSPRGARVRVSKPRWSEINFTALQRGDFVEALKAFELRPTMAETGVFNPITSLHASRPGASGCRS